MRAAFSPPPKRVQEQAKPQEQTSEPEAGIAQPVSAQEQPADSSNKGAEEGGAEPGSNPMFGAESSSEEAGKVAGPQTPQPLLKSGESEMVQLAKPNVINPSLLEPMDTIPPEVAEIQPQEQPGQEYTTANGGSHPLSTPEPPTPSQVSLTYSLLNFSPSRAAIDGLQESDGSGSELIKCHILTCVALTVLHSVCVGSAEKAGNSAV